MEKYILIENKKFYYNEIELYHGRKKIDRNIAKENLLLYYSILEKTNIVYGLLYGTLLGALREKNFIKHDEDTDIFVLSEYKDEFLKLLYGLEELGLKLVRYNKGYLSIMRKNEYIDVYFLKAKKKFGFKKIRLVNNIDEIDARHFQVIDRIAFLGMNMPIPSNATELLVKTYGKNWETPIENYNAVPNSFHVKILKKYPRLSQFIGYAFIAKIYKKILYK
jgi:lipopolysaccharide cholinephosphotransferase